MSFLGSDVPSSVTDYFIGKVGGEGHRHPPIRSSAVHTLQTCPRKFLLEERLGLKGKGYEGALGRGDIYHQFRAHLLKGTPMPQAIRDVQRTMDATRDRLIELAGPSAMLPGGKDLKTILGSAEDDFQVAQAMAECSWSLYPLDFERWEVLRHPSTGEPLIEQTIRLQDESYGEVVVQFDAILLDKQKQEVWISDDKTTRLSPRTFAMSKSFDIQIRLYRWALQKLLGPGFKVVGAVHSVIRVPTIRQTQKESFEQYVERLKQWYRDKAKDSPDDPPIIQSWTRFGESIESPEFRQVMLRQVVHSNLLPVLPQFPRNSGSCFKYDRACPFLELCCSDEVQWPAIIDQRFEIRFRDDETKAKELR